MDGDRAVFTFIDHLRSSVLYLFITGYDSVPPINQGSIFGPMQFFSVKTQIGLAVPNY